MKRPALDSDETVLLAPGHRARPRLPGIGLKVAIGAIGGFVIIVAVIVIAWFVWPGASRVPSPAVRTIDSPVAAVKAELPIETATVKQIQAHQATDLSIIRLAENPQIVVLDFASLTRQRNMLDRIAALIEKADLPRDRILNAEELDRAVKAGGDADAGFYYGHDYSAASFLRFFAIADRTHVQLMPEEILLRHLLDRLGWANSDTMAGMISVPRVGASGSVTVAARNTILTHELSHGEYFSNPVYAAYVHRFFLKTVTPAEQAAFRTFLAGEGYDSGNVDLVENETQAYLLFTPDPLFFSPSQVHMTPERRAELRAGFLRDMQAGWLKDVLSGIP